MEGRNRGEALGASELNEANAGAVPGLDACPAPPTGGLSNFRGCTSPKRDPGQFAVQSPI